MKVSGIKLIKATPVKKGTETTYILTGGKRTREERMACMDFEEAENVEISLPRFVMDSDEPLIDKAGVLFGAEAIIGGLNSMLMPLGWRVDIMPIPIEQVPAPVPLEEEVKRLWP